MASSRKYDVAVWDLEDGLVGPDRVPSKDATGDVLVRAFIDTAKKHGLKEKDLARAAYTRWQSLFAPGKRTTKFLEELRMLIVHPTKLLESSMTIKRIPPKRIVKSMKKRSLKEALGPNDPKSLYRQKAGLISSAIESMEEVCASLEEAEILEQDFGGEDPDLRELLTDCELMVEALMGYRSAVQAMVDMSGA